MNDDSDEQTKAWAAPSPIEHGGRVELRLVEGTEGQVLYLARWFTSEERLDGQVSISPSISDVTIDSPSELPQWLASFTTSLVRTTARKAHEDGSWPRRLTRWRAAPVRETPEPKKD